MRRFVPAALSLGLTAAVADAQHPDAEARAKAGVNPFFVTPAAAPPPGMYPPQGMPPPGMYPPQGTPPPGMYPPQGVPPPGMNPYAPVQAVMPAGPQYGMPAGPVGPYPDFAPAPDYGAAVEGTTVSVPSDGLKQPLFWLTGDGLLTFQKDGKVAAPLAVGSQTTSLPALLADPRGLTAPLGGNPDTGLNGGFRVTGGSWIGTTTRLGVEGSFFWVAEAQDVFTAASNGAGSPVIARPFVDARTGLPSVYLVSFPGAFAGSVSVDTTSRILGAEGNTILRLAGGNSWYLDTVGGFRYLDLDERLTVTQNTTVLAGGQTGFNGQTLVGTGALTVTDRFTARNRFYGGQVGTRVGVRAGRLTLDATGTLALGVTSADATAAGNTALDGGGTANGGLLVTGTNGGGRSLSTFAVAPELGLQAGFHVCDRVKLTCGYSFLYWSRVVRPGDQVSNTVNPAQVPASQEFGGGGPRVTAGPLVTSDYWLQGLSVGAAAWY